jgi:hypothetical protein
MNDTDRASPQEAAVDYLRDAFLSSDRLAMLIRSHDRPQTIQRISTLDRIVDPSFQRWLHFKNDREQADVYVGMNPLKSNSHSRTKDDILSIRHLYVDLDNDGPAALALIGRSGLVPKPNYVLTTSPGKFQVIWNVEGVSQEQAESLLRVMARKFGADPAATDSTRVLRLPGFFNRKYEQDTLVRWEKQSDRVNHLADFKLRIEHSDSPYQPMRRPRSSSGSASHLSQSERDWAFAKRALARGTDPQELIGQIARFREGEKSDPLDYARRTVTKAQYALETERDGDDRNASSEESPSDPDHGVTGA